MLLSLPWFGVQSGVFMHFVYLCSTMENVRDQHFMHGGKALYIHFVH